MSGHDNEGHQPRILIVDDEEVIRDLCARALSDYRVLHAGNGQEAVDILGLEEVDIILTDIMMPVMNGLELLSVIKKRSPDQLVIVMTGFGDKDVILRALKSGADEFIHKPINLLQLKTTLEKTLEKKALREELRQLKRMDRLKSDFLGLVSHKLKTPITVISLFLQTLVKDTDSLQTPEFQRNLRLILEESGYLSSLIHDLLNFSDVILRDGTTEREWINLATLMHECLTDLHENASGRNIKMSSQSDEQLPNLLADRQQIQFALRAVIENAIKFSPSGSAVEICLSSDKQAVTARVTDFGLGIPPEEQPKVFERFYQIDPYNTGQVRGFGLGLFYARQFVREHGGSIELQSQPEQGTVVTLRFPLQPVA